ncbi:MAG: DUF885 domain-containing protein [Sulfurifustaceae bacterium]
MTGLNAIRSQFDTLIEAYYRSWFRFHPESAVDAGVAGYADLLTPCSDEAKGAVVCLNDELRVALDEIDLSALDPDRQIDAELLHGATQLENAHLLDIEPQRPDPRRWLPINAVYQLTVRPIRNLTDAFLARVGRIPSHLREAETDLAAKAPDVPALWAQTTARAARHGAEFILGLEQDPRLAELYRQPQTADTIKKAADALRRYEDFLEQDVAPRASGDFACGAEYFEGLLRSRHFLDVTIEQVHAFGERLFEQTRADLEAACRQLFGHGDFLRAIGEIQTRHPSAEGLLEAYRERVRAAREFVATHGLVTLPPRERLDVIETPSFLRHEIPFAAYSEPAPNDPDQIGRYYVTPPQDAAQLAEHDEIGLAHTCVHEAYPGHHLQFVTANGHATARSLPRLLNPSASFYEGWALYTEQLMQEQGFLDRPESRIVLLRDRLWRALRIMLDVELHTRGLTVDQAAERMVKALGFPRSQAEADLAWYTRSPTVPLGYAVGWRLINVLRAREVGAADTPSLRMFHDRLLAAGSIALPLVIQRMFGDATWRAVRGSVFGDVRS